MHCGRRQVQLSTKWGSLIQANSVDAQLRGCLGNQAPHSATEHALHGGQVPSSVSGGSGCSVGTQEAGAVVQVSEEGNQARDSSKGKGAGADCPREELPQEDVRHLG